MELATAEDMPHTVYMFLEQVSHGLYNDGGVSFHHNAHHLVSAGPVESFLTRPELREGSINKLEEQFTKSGFGKLLIPEQST